MIKVDGQEGVTYDVLFMPVWAMKLFSSILCVKSIKLFHKYI